MADLTYVCDRMTTRAGEGTKTGLRANVAAALSYVLGWVTGIIFLILERENRFVRFHAIQSIVVFGTLSLAVFAFSFIGVAGLILDAIVALLAIILWIELIARASAGQACSVPFASGIARWLLKGNDR